MENLNCLARHQHTSLSLRNALRHHYQHLPGISATRVAHFLSAYLNSTNVVIRGAQAFSNSALTRNPFVYSHGYRTISKVDTRIRSHDGGYVGTDAAGHRGHP